MINLEENKMSFFNLKTEMQQNEYPFIRRDKAVRAKILADDSVHLLIETKYGESEPLKRQVTHEWFEDNFWEGVT